ncbi:MAG TPA: glucosaminidase domain-containing protein [Steroidobacteraceae bacterium]|nr:glucosaminidase domain-containing protein [Steroidobacteraceae bacterium]
MALRIDANNIPEAMTRGSARADAPRVDAHDFKQFAALRRGAGVNDPETLRAVAKQFESLFTKMMLESMRSASFGDPMFGSDQGDMYQDMADDQLAVQLSQGRGLGLADMLIRQLSGGAGAGSAAIKPGSDATTAVATPEQREQFIAGLMPHATEAARELGVDPNNLIAQAALETGWGRSKPGDSHNLFGIKAGAGWSGASVQANTEEFHSGVASRVDANFRAYGSSRESIEDYVRLIRDNPRYASALNTGSDVQAFANALQRGGYATDPDYARKLIAVAVEVGNRTAANEFKSGSAEPISARGPSRISNG